MRSAGGRTVFLIGPAPPGQSPVWPGQGVPPPPTSPPPGVAATPGVPAQPPSSRSHTAGPPRGQMPWQPTGTPLRRSRRLQPPSSRSPARRRRKPHRRRPCRRGLCFRLHPLRASRRPAFASLAAFTPFFAASSGEAAANIADSPTAPNMDRKRQAAGGASPRRATEANPSGRFAWAFPAEPPAEKNAVPLRHAPAVELDRPDFLAVGRTIVRLAGGGEQAASLMDM